MQGQGYAKAHATFRICGIVPIIPTPFREDQEVDWESLRTLVDFAQVSGACAACLPAYASEFYKLSEQETRQILEEAIDQAAGRIPLIAQVNSYSSPQAARLAVAAQKAGASAVCSAAPRLFPLSERDLLRHFDRILQTIDIPFIIQDVNPGGQTVSPEFIANLHRIHPHFRYVKLEEPMMGSKVEAISNETAGEVGVLEGWGGMYMLDLIPVGISGIMPSLGLADILACIFRLAEQGRMDDADEIFHPVLPLIVFSLQNMEMLHHVEKMLLVARGILDKPIVREATLELCDYDKRRIGFLNGKVLASLDRLQLPRNPLTSKAKQTKRISSALDGVGKAAPPFYL